MSNTNPKTGIRYGTIYLNTLNGDVADDLFFNGENISERDAYEELREELNTEAEERGFCESDKEQWIERELEYRGEQIQVEEPTIKGECDGVSYGISWLGGAPLLWVFESPIISKARLCSPCVPNAGDLNSLDEDGYECYGIPDDWRNEE